MTEFNKDRFRLTFKCDLKCPDDAGPSYLLTSHCEDMKLYIAVLVLVFILYVHESYSKRLSHWINHCIKCPPGWGVKTECTATKQTECERCTPGETYSSSYSRNRSCWQCSKCGVGLYEAVKCSKIKDTVCDDCTRVIYRPDLKKNRDFWSKCSYIFLNRARPGSLNAGKKKISSTRN